MNIKYLKLLSVLLTMIILLFPTLTFGSRNDRYDLELSNDGNNFVIYSDTQGDWYLHVGKAGDVNNDGFDDFLIGSRFDDQGGRQAGQTFLFYGKSDWNDLNLSQADASFIGEKSGDWSGSHVTGIGDINNDGYDDFGIEAILNDEAATQAGQSYIFLGSAEKKWTLGTSIENADGSFLREGKDDLAHGIYSVGDVNNDGYSDFIATGYPNDEGGIDAGQVYLVLGKATEYWQMDVSLADANASYIGEQFDWLGIDAAGIGDINKDGYDDFALGSLVCSSSCSSLSRAGTRKVDVIFGRATGDWQMDTPINQSSISISGTMDDPIMSTLSVGWIAGMGDVNDDGFDDFAIAEYMNDEFGADSGKINLFLGRADWDTNYNFKDANASYYGETDNYWAGMEIDLAGDVNNDGFSDMLIGAPYKLSVIWGAGVTTDENQNGRAYIIYGKSSNWKNNVSLSEADEIYTSNQAGDALGYKLSGIGDINNDGSDDFAISAIIRNPENNGKHESIVYIIIDHDGSNPISLTVTRSFDLVPTITNEKGLLLPLSIFILPVLISLILRINARNRKRE